MKKKFLLVLLTFVVAFACATAVAFTGCSRERPERKHTADSENNMPHVHNYSYRIEKKQATCTEDGYRRAYCQCGEYQEEEIYPATGHMYSGTGVISKAATCTEEGIEEFACQNHDCTSTLQKIIPPTGHDFNEWTIKTSANCLSSGTVDVKCKNCGKTEEQVLPAGHNLNEGESECSFCHQPLTAGLEFKPIMVNGEINSYSVAKGTATDAEIVIPTYYNSKPVTEIADNGFGTMYFEWTFTNIPGLAGKQLAGTTDTTIKKIVIPENVTKIGDFAFSGLNALTSINIPSHLSHVGMYSLLMANNIKRIDISDLSAYCKINFDTPFSNSKDCMLYLNGEPIKNIVIPEDITTVKKYTFSYLSGLEEITIPDHVISLQDGAFFICDYKKLNIGKNVIDIGQSVEMDTYSDLIEMDTSALAFCGSSSLEEITVSSLNKKYRSEGNCLIESDKNLLIFGCKNSVIPTDGINKIGDFAFMSNNGLTEISVPPNIKEIGYGAFYQCENLSAVTFAENLKNIGAYAFAGCAIEEIDLPESIRVIQDNAFELCDISELTLPEGLTELGVNTFSSYSLKTVNWNCVDCQVTSSIIMPAFIKAYSTATTVPEVAKELAALYRYFKVDNLPDLFEAMLDCYNIFKENIVSLNVGEEVKNLPYKVFNRFEGIENLLWGTSLSVESYINNNCKIKNLTFENYKTNISLKDFTAVESVTIGDGVTEINDYAFYNCTSLTSVTIGDDVTSIGYDAFWGCTALESITIPDSVTSILGYAFDDCTSLERVNITSIKSWCNIGFDFTSSNPLYYAHNLYLDGELVKNLEIPEDVTSIKQYAFYYCTSLESVTIGEGVTSIGRDAFYGCASLESITIPDGVTFIGKYAFGYCTSLESITIPDSVTSIGNYAFEYCTSLESIEVDEENQNYSSQDGILYNKEKTQFILIPPAIKGAVTIPDSVTEIGEGAFYYCTSLESVTIGNGVTSIGQGAFSGCTSLESITIPDSVTTIGDWAFQNCTSLNSVTIGNGVTSIGQGAFVDCTSLESITIPDSVTYIDAWAFDGCTALTNITIPDSVTEIGNYAFEYCTSLESVTIGDSVTEIYSNAFLGCTSLESITIPDSVTTIGERAFQNCTALNSVTFKNTAGWKADGTAVDVTNPTRNAKYLKETYCRSTWRREG